MTTRRLLICTVASALFWGAGCSRQPLVVQSHTAKLYALDSTKSLDSALVRLIVPYKQGVDTLMRSVIGQATIPLTKAQPESTLGNFMADAQLEAARRIDAKVMASIVNYGGIRLPYMAPGPITKGKIYELMPFDNIVTIVEIPGSVLYRFCDHMAARKGWPVAGLRFSVKGRKATDIALAGGPVDSARIYKIAVSDYIAHGGDDCEFLRPLKKRYTSIFLRDALIEYIEGLTRAGQTLSPKLDQRVSYAE